MSDTCSWLGHEFIIYNPETVAWNDVAGIYIFSGLNPLNQWVPIYVGQADSFRNRIPSHERWNEAVRLGATRIHAKSVPLAANRGALERLLIGNYQPTLNTQHKGLSAFGIR